jgi:hypothetical protein
MSNTSPKDQRALQFDAPARAVRQPAPGEVLFEILFGHKRWLCELRDHGAELGVEVQFYENEELAFARRFDPRLDRSRPSREMAVQWAEEMRTWLQRDRGSIGGEGAYPP